MKLDGTHMVLCTPSTKQKGCVYVFNYGIPYIYVHYTYRTDTPSILLSKTCCFIVAQLRYRIILKQTRYLVFYIESTEKSWQFWYHIWVIRFVDDITCAAETLQTFETIGKLRIKLYACSVQSVFYCSTTDMLVPKAICNYGGIWIGTEIDKLF